MSKIRKELTGFEFHDPVEEPEDIPVPDVPDLPSGHQEAPEKTDSPIFAIMQLYRIYPKKSGKRRALAAIRTALSRDSFHRILRGVNAFAYVCSLAPAESFDFIPYPATWFNQDRWTDDPAVWINTLKLENPEDVLEEVQEHLAGRSIVAVGPAKKQSMTPEEWLNRGARKQQKDEAYD